jgi:hypothetical protein
MDHVIDINVPGVLATTQAALNRTTPMLLSNHTPVVLSDSQASLR